MKVLVIPSWYPPDGGSFFVNETLWLKEFGVDAEVITVEQISLKKLSIKTLFTLFRITKQSEFGIFTYRLKIIKLPKSFRLNAFIWRRSMLILAHLYLKENESPNLLHVHSCLWGGFVAAKIKKKYEIPYLITEHRGRFNEYNITKQYDFKNWYNPIIKEGLQHADAIIPVSDLLCKTLEEKAELKLKFFPIPNPVDDKKFFPHSNLNKNDKTTAFCSVTNFLSVKAVDNLIYAFKTALTVSTDIKLNIIGDGTGKSKIKKLVNDLEISNYVTFYGKQPSEKVNELINQSDFLVISSKNEGQPVILGETLLCGKPAISTNIVNKTDLPTFAGIIVQAGNIDELSKALLKGHHEKLKFNSEEIRKFAISRFSKKIVISEIFSVMKSISK